MSDEDLFRSEMQGVEPIKHTRTQRPHGEPVSNINHEAARRAAQEDNADTNTLVDSFIPELDPHAVLEYHKPGVQHGVLKKLRTGQYSLDARLDLHKHSVEQARHRLYEFVQDCLRYDVRTAIVIHGKGDKEKKDGRRAVIKSCVNHWLKELPDVLAFHTAQPRHGGKGAVYVLLRKSDALKEKTRESLRRRD